MDIKLQSSEEEIRAKFFALHTRADVAELLEIDKKQLNYHLYIVPPSKRYAVFEIPKKSGGVRKIMAPVTALKILQKKLNKVLMTIYHPKAPVQGFVPERSIVTNAQRHKRQRYVLNLDLKDFFPSINFGRVRGMFMATPYKLDPEAATVLAQVCCFDNQLPQGSPTSPIVSNMICAKMDSQLRLLAQKHKCIYTRYADDITFSTSLPQFPPALARHSERTGQLELGDELLQLIKENGFEVNPQKVRLRTRNRRQEVTGLTVNRFPNVERKYVRQIRAMLHAWKIYGLDAAEKEFLSKYDKKHRKPRESQPSFEQVVKGKIEFLGMVKGKNDDIYLRFRGQLKILAPELVKELPAEPSARSSTIIPLIITEGKTDWKHLKSALQRLKAQGRLDNLNVELHEYEDEMGDTELQKMCNTYSKTLQLRPTIFIFDRDKPQIVRDVSGRDGGYKEWKNNVYSFAIPVPSHRQATPDVSIELFYEDSEIKSKDRNGRRLFLSNEFHPRSGKHKTEREINCTDNKVRKSALSIIDDQVFDVKDENIALPKSEFANYVLAQEENFNNFNVSEFSKIFDVIAEIVKDSGRL